MNNCINLIKTCIIFNKKGFIVTNNNKNLSILKAFIKLNIIKFIKFENKNNKLIVHINYLNGKPVFTNIVNMFKVSKKKFVNLKTLKYLSLKHNSIIILSTNKGVLNSYEAINAKVGGLVIAEIWN